MGLQGITSKYEALSPGKKLTPRVSWEKVDRGSHESTVQYQFVIFDTLVLWSWASAHPQGALTLTGIQSAVNHVEQTPQDWIKHRVNLWENKIDRHQY